MSTFDKVAVIVLSVIVVMDMAIGVWRARQERQRWNEARIRDAARRMEERVHASRVVIGTAGETIPAGSMVFVDGRTGRIKVHR